MSADSIETYTRVEKIDNIPYRDWTYMWWFWALRGPRENNPLLDTTGANALRNQPVNHNVMFLAGTLDRQVSPVTRIINSNTKSSLLLPIVNSCISIEEHDDVFSRSDSNAELSAAVNNVITKASGSLHISIGNSDADYTIDTSGKRSPERIETTEMVNLAPGQGIVYSRRTNSVLDFMRAALDGYWVFLKPLAKGQYTFTIHGEAPWFGPDPNEPKFETNVTYQLGIT